MNAPLYYEPRSHELDAIVRADCGEAADDDGCATLGQLPEISEDLLLGRRAHSREQVGSVRNRDLGGPQEGPGQQSFATLLC